MRVLAVFALLWAARCCLGEQTLLPKGSVWAYYYNGPVSTNWNQAGFDDRTWARGPATIGWADGGERTVAFDDGGYEPTLYFRRTFNLTNFANVFSATVRLMVDDGAIAYLNGTEILRRNMPSAPADFFTPAVRNVETNENNVAQLGVRLENLRPGTNLIAVEVHQHPNGGHDAVFDPELLVNIPIGPPSLLIRTPSDGALLSLGDLLIETVPSDPDGNVTQVSFFADTSLLADVYGDPFTERMLTVRLHFDDTDASNGALRVMPSSHKFGRLSAARIRELRAEGSEIVCAVSAGDALLMRPLLLHASGRSTQQRHRRVLHIDYAGFDLPSGLQWPDQF